MSCKHIIVYGGAMNVVIRGEVDGTVDLWKCKLCGGTAADWRRIGEPKMPDSVGMGDLVDAGRWGIIVCKDNGKIEWHLAQSSSTIHHKCSVFGECELKVDDGGNPACNMGHDHRFHFISEHINSSLVIE